MNKKQRVFVEEYLKCWNASEAARRAGYSHPGQMGYQLLHRTSIKQEIANRIEKTAMSADEVLFHITKIATADVSSVIEPTGKRTFLIDTDKIKEYGHLIKSIRHTKYGVAVEFYNKLQALQLLGKHLALFTDRVKIDDWRSEIVELLKEGTIKPEQVIDEFGNDLATELFAAAGVYVGQSGETEARVESEKSVAATDNAGGSEMA
jgi:phage terminase small subunit